MGFKPQSCFKKYFKVKPASFIYPDESVSGKNINYYISLITRKVKSIQRPGTGAIRTQIPPSKPKREITKITNSQNTRRTYGQLSGQLFPNRWPLSNPNRTKNNMNKPKVKCHQN